MLYKKTRQVLRSGVFFYGGVPVIFLFAVYRYFSGFK
jgi:hypothetical protein